jgi:hypothetical protein
VRETNPNQERLFSLDAGLPDVFFQTKYPDLGKFWKALEWKMLVDFIAIWNIFRAFGIPILGPFVNLVAKLVCFPPFWYIESRKIGQPGSDGQYFPCREHFYHFGRT